MTEKEIPSSGGKKFTVRRNGCEVEMAWVDEIIRHKNGDALFAPEDAVSLGEALILIGREVQQVQNVPNPDEVTVRKPASGIRGLLEQVGVDTTGKDIRVGDRVVDAWPHSCAYRTMRCNLARTRQEHAQHDWEPQPGMTPLHCPGWNQEEVNQ